MVVPLLIRKSKLSEYGISEKRIEETLRYKKADIQIKLQITIDDVIYRENLFLKRANNNANFNQIDKRPVDTYQKCGTLVIQLQQH